MVFVGLAFVVFALSSTSDVAAQVVPLNASVMDSAGNASVMGEEKLWHMLSPELQHTLSGVLEKHGTDDTLSDPAVDALMSNLLHDELDTRWKSQAADEERHAKEAADLAKAEDDQARTKHEQQMKELEALRKTHEAEREAAKAQREAERKHSDQEAKERQKEHEEMVRKNSEFMQKTKTRREHAEKRRAEMQLMHSKTWERTRSLLGQVHEELEAATGGWRDAPFWDDFFRTSSAAARFSQALRFSHIEPALRASSMTPEHNVLVLEPRGASLADRLAEEIRAASIHHTEAHAYGAEGDEGKDIVVEVGLLDAMAMGGSGADASKLEALKNASARLARLVKPGGTWISVSAVPPTLRVPLLGRLAGGSFSLPSEKEDSSAGTHAVVLSATDANGKDKSKVGLRGSATVADMLLYGSEDVHVWAYRMQRGENPVDDHVEIAAASPDGLLDIIRQQRPATRDDL